jgi:hypothetical protein
MTSEDDDNGAPRADESATTYQVGYGKPPLHSRFKKGVSGNPRGRKKGSKNFATLVEEGLQERVQVTIAGKTKSVSRSEAIVLAMMTKAMKGDPQGIRMVLDLAAMASRAHDEGHDSAQGSAIEDHEILMRAFKLPLGDA